MSNPSKRFNFGAVFFKAATILATQSKATWDGTSKRMGIEGGGGTTWLIGGATPRGQTNAIHQCVCPKRNRRMQT